MKHLKTIDLIYHTLHLQKRHHFYICDNLVKCHPILPILGRNVASPRVFKTNVCTEVQSLHVCTFKYSLPDSHKSAHLKSC